MLRDRGIAIIVVLLAMLLLAVIAGGMAAVGSHTLQLSRSSMQGDQALLAADSGAWRTAGELARNDAFPGFPLLPLPSTGATYRTSVTKGPGTAPNGVSVPAGLTYVLSTGTFGKNVRQVGLLLRLGSSPFATAVFAADTVTVDDASRVDSWDSSQGNYPTGSQASRAHVGTNSVAPNCISWDSGSIVDGTLYVGPGAPPNAAFIDTSDGAAATGGVSTLTQLRPLPPVTLPANPPANFFDIKSDQSLPPGTYGHLTLDDGAVLTLTGGTYTFRSIRVKNGSTIGLDPAMTSAAQVFVAESFDMEDGSLVNSSRKPAMLEFNVKQGPVTLDDDAGSAYFVCYAPEATVDIDDNSHMYGSLVGKEVIVDNDSQLSYDLALGSSTGGATTLTVVSRQEF
ncbi:MAG: hypothetical protein AB1758_25370 [Candidatus Eremiobacterota bacterium]